MRQIGPLHRFNGEFQSIICRDLPIYSHIKAGTTVQNAHGRQPNHPNCHQDHSFFSPNFSQKFKRRDGGGGIVAPPCCNPDDAPPITTFNSRDYYYETGG